MHNIHVFVDDLVPLDGGGALHTSVPFMELIIGLDLWTRFSEFIVNLR